MKCPECGKTRIAKIFWGLPANLESLKKDLDQGKIILGGCTITGNDPKWHCNDCLNKWGQPKKDLEKNDSFDFDQGFNLDEVYD